MLSWLDYHSESYKMSRQTFYDAQISLSSLTFQVPCPIHMAEEIGSQ